ncbi:MAG: HEXXH motif-containing putative peptide modification protein [Synechococcaceae cyanobacterium]|nr:HEXXH motif-containing putative peptide modification protein [Synechococcaceae cyanobacterium]
MRLLPEPSVHPAAVGDLCRSLALLADHVPPSLPAASAALSRLAAGDGREAGPDAVSPWPFLLYGELVPRLQEGMPDNDLRLLVNTLGSEFTRPCPGQPVLLSFGDASIPALCWEVLLRHLTQEEIFPEDLLPPDPALLPRLQEWFPRVHDLLRQADPDLQGRMEHLQRLVVLARPGPRSLSRSQRFGGATMLFFWRGTVLNADPLRSLPALLEQMVHEYGHGALFALGKDSLLCLNDDRERYPVSIRSDPRPMYGILHSFYVTTLVADVFDRLLDRQDRLAPPLSSEEQGEIRERAARNRGHARSSLQAIETHARLTPLGDQVVRATASALH